ncbi:protein rep [Massilia agri]|uniref:Protein rep n=1 Tax=Massilia agri TaxID=1886785 RepID=A0ABT2AHC7_9BURK|nr:protein rep [Massilia agri]
MSNQGIVTLPLPKGFGIEVDLESGEVRKQIAPGQYEVDQFEAVATSYLLRSAARKLLARFRWVKASGMEVPAYRVVRCGVAVIDQKQGVAIYRAIQHKRAHFGGIVQCGSVWHCPVCARKIAVRRRAELVIATNRMNESGGVCGLLTCTVPHAASDRCADVLERLQRLFDRLNSGKAAKSFRDRFAVVGQIRALEFTKGLNGWHPHVHSLLFCEKPVQWLEVGNALWSRWASAALREYGWNLPRLALDVRGGNTAGEYVGKWGLEFEVAGGSLKSARGDSFTPFGLLGQYSEGDKAAGESWVEYATAVSRMGQDRIESSRQLVWSRGLKARFQIADLTDEQIAEAQEEPSVLLGSLNFEQWLKVLGQPFDARVVLLQIASVGTFEDVLSFVNSLPECQDKTLFSRS